MASSSSAAEPSSDPSLYTIPFSSSTTPHEWEHYLQHLQGANFPVTIIAKMTCYKDNKAKRFYTLPIEQNKDNLDPIAFKQAKETWEKPITVTTARAQLRASGTLMLLSGPTQNAVQRIQNWNMMEWHTVAAFWKNGVMGVYDSSFGFEGVRCEKDMVGVILLKQLMGEMRKQGKAVNELWVGGGGNYTVIDSEMTRAWMEDEVVKKEGRELGKWEGRKGWKQVKR